MRSTILLGMATVLLASTTAARADEAMARKLAGTYTIESGKDGTLIIPEERLRGSVKVAGDKMTLYDADNKEVYVIQFELKGDSMPAKVAMKTIDSTKQEAEGSKALVLIKLEGDTLTIMYDFGDEAIYPEDFVPQTDKQHMFVLKRKGGN